MKIILTKNFFFISAGIFILFLAVLIASAYIYAPKIAQKTALKAFATLGLETEFLPEPKKGWGRIDYAEAPLDKDGISTVKKIEARYNPFVIIFAKRLESLSISSLEVIGNQDKENQDLITFSGWDIPRGLRSLSGVPAERLHFDKARISLLTHTLGGLSLEFDFEGTRNGRAFDFQAYIKSAQKYISFSAGINGIAAPDYSTVDMDIDQGKFEVPDADIKASRVFGWMNYSDDKSGQPKVMSELSAGGMIVLGLPWQNATAAMEFKDGNLRIYSEAKSLGIEGIELSLNLKWLKDQKSIIFGDIHAENGLSLADYFSGKNAVAFPVDDLKKFGQATNLKIDYVYKESEAGKKLRYRIGPEASVQEMMLP